MQKLEPYLKQTGIPISILNRQFKLAVKEINAHPNTLIFRFQSYKFHLNTNFWLFSLFFLKKKTRK